MKKTQSDVKKKSVTISNPHPPSRYVSHGSFRNPRRIAVERKTDADASSPLSDDERVHFPSIPCIDLRNDVFTPFRMSVKDLRMQLDLTTPGDSALLADARRSDSATDDDATEPPPSDEEENSEGDEAVVRPKKISLETIVLLASETSFSAADFPVSRMPSLESSDINASGHSEFGLLNSMTTADGALYYIRNACIEKVQLERAENESFVASPFILVAPEDSRLLQPRKGVPSYLTWENRTTHAERSIILDEDDSVAYPLHQSIQGTVVGLMSFSEGLHCWNLWFSDLQNVAFGVVSKMGVDSFYSCRSGAMPDYVACIKPNAFLEHRLHWKDSKGIEHWRTLDPPLSAYAKAADNEVSVVLDFYHKQITFLCNEKLVCTVSFNRRSDDHVGRGPLSPRDKHRSTPLLGDHTVFAHLKHGSRVKLIQKIKRVYDTLTSTMEGVPPPRIMAGNPYARWGIVDGQGTEAVFTLPLGLCHWNDCVWVTDCNAVRRINAVGVVTSFYPKLVPENCQAPIQYLGCIHVMRNRLFVTDLTNRTILCIDPHTWEARLVMTKGSHGFRPCSSARREQLSSLIDDMRAHDYANAILSKEAAAAVIRSCTATMYGIRSIDFSPYRLGPAGLTHVPHGWLFVSDPERHCIFVADLSSGKSPGDQNAPKICAGMSGEAGRADGEGSQARFKYPTSLVGDVDNLLMYVSDTGNNRLAKVQLVWNDLRRRYSTQVTTLNQVNTVDLVSTPFRIRCPTALSVYSDLGCSLLAAETGSDTIFQVQLQPSLKSIGLTFASPYDQLVMMLKQSRREAENMPQVNVEHCKTVGRALDLILSTPNIYQVEYVGGALDDDVARYLSDTYAPQGIVWEEEADADGTPTAAVRRRSSCVNFNSRNSQTKLIEKDKKSAATVRFDDAPSKALGIELLGLDSLDFNVFDVNRLCDDSGGVLVQVAMNVFSRYRFFPRYFGTPELVHRLIQFFSKIQAGYHRENYYHNHIHAADVLQTVHWLINTSGVVEKISDVDCFSVLLSAVIHDYDHPGVSNAFLVNSKDDIALHFNDQSVLENHHLFLSFQLLRVESYSILESFTEHEQKIIRESMITHVFGTDMKNHFKSLGELKARQQALRDEGGDFSASPDDKILLLKSMLHAADISNPVKYKAVYLEWTKRVMKEFREQGKRESDLEMAISPFCDSEADVAKCQKGFIEFVVRPLYVCLSDAYPSLRITVENLDVNVQHWKDMENNITPASPSGALKPKHKFSL